MAIPPRIEKLTHLGLFGKNLLTPELQGRDIKQRLSPEEKYLLARNIREAWGVSPERRDIVPYYNFSETTRVTNYKDRDNQLLKREGLETNGQIDLIAHLETPEDVFHLRSFLRSIDNPETTLATMILPAERGDRPETREEEVAGETIRYEEIVDIRTHLQDLALSGVKRLIMSGTHSPVLSYFALESGIAIVDLIPLPALFDFAAKKGLFQNKSIVPVTGDDGASAMGELVEGLAGEYGISSIRSVHAHKTKKDNKTEVHFDPQELTGVKGKTVVIPEDILSTGGTLEDTTNQLITAGAEEIIILVTYPFFADGALERLGNKEKVTIITTDAKTPLNDISSARNIVQIPIKERFNLIMELDRQGIDYWSEVGQQALRQLGFCLNPWMNVN